jgi:hypothetical protein
MTATAASTPARPASGFSPLYAAYWLHATVRPGLRLPPPGCSPTTSATAS